MFKCNNFYNIINCYHENKLSHAFLLETNDIDQCYKDVLDISDNVIITKDRRVRRLEDVVYISEIIRLNYIIKLLDIFLDEKHQNIFLHLMQIFLLYNQNHYH